MNTVIDLFGKPTHIYLVEANPSFDRFFIGEWEIVVDSVGDVTYNPSPLTNAEVKGLLWSIFFQGCAA